MLIRLAIMAVLLLSLTHKLPMLVSDPLARDILSLSDDARCGIAVVVVEEGLPFLDFFFGRESECGEGIGGGCGGGEAVELFEGGVHFEEFWSFYGYVFIRGVYK